MKNLVKILKAIPGSLYRTLKYASKTPFWEWF